MSAYSIIRFIVITEVARQGIKRLFNSDFVPSNFKRAKNFVLKSSKLKFKNNGMNVYDYYINYKLMTNKPIKDRLKKMFEFNGNQLLHTNTQEEEMDIVKLPKLMTIYIIDKETNGDSNINYFQLDISEENFVSIFISKNCIYCYIYFIFHNDSYFI